MQLVTESGSWPSPRHYSVIMGELVTMETEEMKDASEPPQLQCGMESVEVSQVLWDVNSFIQIHVNVDELRRYICDAERTKRSVLRNRTSEKRTFWAFKSAGLKEHNPRQ